MALDKFQPYLFVSAGEQSNKYLTPTYADGIAKFQAQRAQELTGLTVRIDPIQEGTGDPSPTNIRPISGRTGLTVTVQSGETQNEYSVTWETEAGTVYGGTLDVVSGVLTVDKYFLTCADTITPNVGAYAYATNPNRWQIPLSGDYMPSEDKMGESIGDTFDYYNGGLSQWADGTFRFSGIQSGGYRLIQFKWADQPTTVADLKALLAENPIHFVIPLATPQTYRLTGAEVRTLAGFNQIYSDAGQVIDIKF